MFASLAAKQTNAVANTAATVNNIFRVFMESPLAYAQDEPQIAANHTPISTPKHRRRKIRPRRQLELTKVLRAPDYCVGLPSCVNPIAFTSRNIGVRGGNNDGVRNAESKV